MLTTLPHIRALGQEDTLTVEICGDFDLRLSFNLWQACRLESDQYRQFTFDLASVGELRDSGLAWLMMFHRHARKLHARVSVINCRPTMAARCEAMGLEVVSVFSRMAVNAGSQPYVTR